MDKFNVTYEIVTPESAAYGEAAESGFVAKDIGLREAADMVGNWAVEADCYPVTLATPPRWLTNCEYCESITEGSRESRSLHLPANVTPATAMRIARLMKCYGITPTKKRIRNVSQSQKAHN